MINIKHWSKGILSLYPYLEIITKAIDRLVLQNAIVSSSYPMGGLRSVDNVVSLSQYKIDIINLKHLTDVSLNKMNKEEASALITRYIDSVSIDDCIMLSNKSRRTYFRLINKAMKNFEIIFYAQLCQSGIFDNPPRNSFWEEMFKKVNDFSKIYEISLYSSNICSMILKKIRRIAVL